MNDTSKKVREIQLQIWLSKSPGERLGQMLADNEALWTFWNTIKNSSDKTQAIQDVVTTPILKKMVWVLPPLLLLKSLCSKP